MFMYVSIGRNRRGKSGEGRPLTTQRARPEKVGAIATGEGRPFGRSLDHRAGSGSDPSTSIRL